MPDPSLRPGSRLCEYELVERIGTGGFFDESGRLLAVNATIEGSRATHIWLCGEGRLVARGVWLDA